MALVAINVSFPVPPSRKSSPAFPSIKSFPAFPSNLLAWESPINVSKLLEPATFIIPYKWSVDSILLAKPLFAKLFDLIASEYIFPVASVIVVLKSTYTFAALS